MYMYNRQGHEQHMYSIIRGTDALSTTLTSTVKRSTSNLLHAQTD